MTEEPYALVRARTGLREPWAGNRPGPLGPKRVAPPLNPKSNDVTDADLRLHPLETIVCDMSDVTRILSQIEQGDPRAAEQLLPLVYDELRKLAAAKMAQEKPGQTLQATALVHEAFLKLVDDQLSQHWNSRGHFFGAAAEAMRRILVDNARKKRSQKEGGGWQRRALEDLEIVDPADDEKLITLDEALTRLETKDASKARLVKLRFFAGLTIDQAAEALGISTATAERHWTYARAWLQREMS
jgi:RNA polymerase sigma factor (TIGR02999 family)